jgi:hypothetical protein
MVYSTIFYFEAFQILGLIYHYSRTLNCHVENARMLLQTSSILLALGICLAYALPNPIVENLYETRTEVIDTTIEYVITCFKSKTA